MFGLLLRVDLRAVRITILAVFLSAAPAANADRAPIPSGLFDMNVMVATDEASQRITGYINLQACRFYFTGNAADFKTDETVSTFTTQAWRLNRPLESSTLSISSFTKEKFQHRITLRTEGNALPRSCPENVWLDRVYNVSVLYIGVRVVRVRDMMLFDLVRNGSETKLVRLTGAPPDVEAGVWEERTYGVSYRVPRFVRIAWYEPSGKTRVAYVRERDLYPIEAPPSAVDSAAKSNNQ